VRTRSLFHSRRIRRVYLETQLIVLEQIELFPREKRLTMIDLLLFLFALGPTRAVRGWQSPFPLIWERTDRNLPCPPGSNPGVRAPVLSPDPGAPECVPDDQALLTLVTSQSPSLTDGVRIDAVRGVCYPPWGPCFLKYTPPSAPPLGSPSPSFLPFP